MAAHNGDGPQDLPATWPFRAAGTLLIAALIWFCLGFAIEDIGNDARGAPDRCSGCSWPWPRASC